MRLNRRSIEGTPHAYEEVTSVDRVKEDALTRVHLPCLEGTSCFSNERSFLSAHPVHTQLVTARGRRDGAVAMSFQRHTRSDVLLARCGPRCGLLVRLDESGSLLEQSGLAETRLRLAIYGFEFAENAQAPCRRRSTVAQARLVQLTPRYIAAGQGKDSEESWTPAMG